MDRTEAFPALTISTLQIRLTTAELTVTVDDIPDVQVTISGEDASAVRLAQQSGVLTIKQAPLALRKVTSVTVALPANWKGALDARTLTGAIHASGVSGSDLMLRSLTGGVYASGLTGITAHLRTLTGPIGVSDLACDICRVRTLTGQMLLNACGFMACRISALCSRSEMDLAAPFDAITARYLLGGLTVYAPIDHADATLASLRGRLLTDGVSIAAGASRVTMSSMTANLQIIRSTETPAAM